MILMTQYQKVDSVLSEIHLWNKEHEQAIKEMKKAVSLAPNKADFIAGLGGLNGTGRKPGRGHSLLKRAISHNPVHPAYYLWFLGHAYYLIRRYDEALEAFERAHNLNPDWWPSHVYSAVCYVEMGQIGKAKAEAAKVIKAQPTFSIEH